MELKFRTIREINEEKTMLENLFWSEMFNMISFEKELNKAGIELDSKRITDDVLNFFEIEYPSFYKYLINNYEI